MYLIFSSFMTFFICMGSALAQQVAVDENLASRGWQELLFEDKKPNIFSADGGDGIEVHSEQSVSVLYKKIEIDLLQTPKLTWAWKVEKPVPITDLTQKGKDDRALGVYVSFPFDEERAGFWERFIRAFVVAFKGEDTPGRVISYVWGGDVHKGEILESPYFKGAGAMVVLQNAQTFGQEWHIETVDVAKDYERIFGLPANQPYQIAVSADTDDTLVESLGWVKGLHFE